MTWKTRVYALIILVLVGLLYLNRQRQPQITFSKETPKVTSTSIAGFSEDAPEARLEAETLVRELAEAVPEVEPEFRQWLQSEVQAVDSPNPVDTDNREVELTKRAAAFQRRHIDYLVQRSLTSETPLSEKILSTYLLSLNGDAQGLRDIASQPIANPGPHPAHSPEETLLGQERAKRLMAIDGIFNGSADITTRVQDLQKIAEQSTDSVVKSYAMRKLSELQAQM